MKTLRPVRDQALNDLSSVVTAMWGERCARVEGGCATCVAWAAFDLLERITEGSTLDDEDDYMRVASMFHIDRK